MHEHPTMRDLAKSLRVSVTTVSMALRNHPRVAVETRRLVQAFARENNYRLNPSVTSLMSRVRFSSRARYQETLGWLNCWEDEDHFTRVEALGAGEYSLKLWQGVSERAEKLGYRVDSFWLGKPRVSGRCISAIMRARGIRGLLIPPLPKSCGRLTINWSEFAAIALSYTLARPQLHRVVPDHHHNMQVILRELRHRGYKRAGLLMHEGFDERVENRLRSAFYFYQQTLSARDRVPVLLCPGEGSDAVRAAWLKKFRPDAVITLGSQRHLREIVIGDPAYSQNLGIALMGYATTDAGFAAIDENPLRIGATAVDQLVAQLNRNERGIPESAQTVMIKGSWVEGGTLEKHTQRPPCFPSHRAGKSMSSAACITTL